MKSKTLFYTFFLIYSVWAILTLTYSPIVWFDEIFMADYTRNLITTGHLYNTLDPTINKHCIYGPVFFIISAIPTSIFGLNIFTVRVVNLVAFFISALFVGKILKEYKVCQEWIFFLVFLFLLDPLNISNSHSGRNDFTAIALFLASFWMYKKKYFGLRYVMAISLLLTLAYLTTPRIAVVATPLALVVFINLIRSKNYLSASFYVCIPIIIISSWLTISYGSPITFFEHITHSSSNDSRGASSTYFLCGGFHIAFYHYIPLLLSLINTAICFVKKKYKTGVLLFLPIILYYMLITDFGGYSMFITSFFYISIGLLMLNTEKTKNIKYLAKGAVILILLTNISIFIFKSATIFLTLNTRDETKVELWMKEHLPKGSKVASNFEYYYAIIHSGSDFKRLWREGYSAETTRHDILTNYHPDYIMVKDFRFKYENEFITGMKLEKIASYHPEDTENHSFKSLLKTLHLDLISMTYAGTLYKVVYTNEELIRNK